MLMPWRLSSGFECKVQKHFSNCQNFIFSTILYLKPTGCSIVHFVGDKYDIPDNVSLMCEERLRRNQSKFGPEYISVDNIEIPD